MPTPDRRPRYRAIADDLAAAIHRGAYRAGEKLPNEHDLAQRYGTSRPTLARALDQLKRAGVIESRQGAGTFVRAQPDQTDEPDLDHLAAEVRRLAAELSRVAEQLDVARRARH